MKKLSGVSIFVLSFLITLTSSAQSHAPFKNSVAYVKKVKYYRYLNPDSAILLVNEGLKLAKQSKDTSGLAALLNQSGMIDDNAGRFKESRNKYLAAEKLYKAANDDIGLASTLIRLGVVEQRKGNYDKSLGYFINALKISEKNKDKLGMMEGHITLSETYMNIGKFEETAKQLRIAEAINHTIPVSNLTMNMYINLGKLNLKLKKYNKAIGYIQTGLSHSNKVEFNGFKITFLSLLAKIYNEKKDQTKAIKLLNEALTFAKQIKNVIRELSCLLDLAAIYKDQSPKNALRYLQEGLLIAEKYKLYNQQIVILDEMADLHKTQGDFEKALALREQSYNIAEEYYYKDMLKQISSLETAYDKEKANVEFRELQIKNNEQEQNTNIILAIAVGTFILLILSASFYYRSRHLNKLLVQSNQQLEENNKEKDRFFSIVAHDIRSPLVSTLSFLRLINDEEIDEKIRIEMVGKLILHCEGSLEILDKLLKWGQMQIKGVRLNVTNFKAIENIQQAIAHLKAAADQKSITIEISVDSKLTVHADQDHFDFIFRNLLANAIKFTKLNGTVALTADLAKEGWITFFVKDNGVGISPSRLKNIFKLASTGTKGTSNEEGTSLGLIICKEFIDANGGWIEVESEEGKGTTFTFQLKAAEVKTIT